MSEPCGFSAQVYICANDEASISAKNRAVFYSAKGFHRHSANSAFSGQYLLKISGHDGYKQVVIHQKCIVTHECGQDFE